MRVATASTIHSMSRPAPTQADRLRSLSRLPLSARALALGEALVASTGVDDDHGRRAIEGVLLEIATLPEPRTWLARWARGPSVFGLLPRDVALRALIRAYTGLSEDARAVVNAVPPERLERVCELVLTAPDPTSRAAVATLAASTMLPALARPLTDLLEDQDERVANEAERAWLRLAFGACADPGVVSLIDDPSARERVDVAVLDDESALRLREELAFALGRFGKHRRMGVLLAAIAMLDRRTTAREKSDDPLARWMRSEPDVAHAALRGIVRWHPASIVRRRAWEWAWDESWRSVCVERLAHAMDLDDHEAVLVQWHLALRPSRRAALQAIEPRRALRSWRERVPASGSGSTSGTTATPASEKLTGTPKPGRRATEEDGLLPRTERVARLSATARRGLVEFARATRTPTELRRRAVEPLLVDPEPMVRHALARLGDRRGVEDLCFDRDERVARSAFVRWSGAGEGTRGPGDDEDHRRSLLSMSRVESRSVREWANMEHSHALPGSGALWRNAARERLRMNRERELDTIRLALARGGESERFEALALVRALDLADEVAEPLGDLLQSHVREGGDDRVAATAAAALGSVASLPARGVLLGALRDHDGRVRANAAEALRRQHTRGLQGEDSLPPALRELRQDDHHRARGAAVRGLVEFASTQIESKHAQAGAMASEASRDLLAMLNDERAPHRLAGVWTASRSVRLGAGRLPEAAAVVRRAGELVATDEDPRVRARARGWVLRLEREIRLMETNP